VNKTRVTPPSAALRELTPPQAIALEAIDSGRTHAEAAEAAGVDRDTVTMWVKLLPAFEAELNRREAERALLNVKRINDLTVQVVEAVRTAVESGDLGTALQWLRIRGFDHITVPPPGPTSPDAVIEQRRQSMARRGGIDDVSITDLMKGALPTREEAIQSILEELGGRDG
jgi:hypothetical protein